VTFCIDAANAGDYRSRAIAYAASVETPLIHELRAEDIHCGAQPASLAERLAGGSPISPLKPKVPFARTVLMIPVGVILRMRSEFSYRRTPQVTASIHCETDNVSQSKRRARDRHPRRSQNVPFQEIVLDDSSGGGPWRIR
jgi:hypothetical protein